MVGPVLAQTPKFHPHPQTATRGRARPLPTAHYSASTTESLSRPFAFISLQIPLPATPFFSHRSESPGAWVSPFEGSFLQSRNSRASYHIPATLAVSCSYTLFCATAHGYLPYSQQLPHSFYRHGGGTPLHGQIPQRLLQPRPQLPGKCGRTIRRVSGLQYTLRPGNSRLRAFKRTPWINA
jgi:hypothetical protein